MADLKFENVNLYKNEYLNVFGVAESNYDSRISKFKMADRKFKKIIGSLQKYVHLRFWGR